MAAQAVSTQGLSVLRLQLPCKGKNFNQNSDSLHDLTAMLHK